MKAIAAILWIVLGGTLAGIGLMIVLATPQLSADAIRYIPYAAAAGFALAIPLSLMLASKLKGRVRS